MAEINWSGESKKDLRAIADYFDKSSRPYSRYLIQSIYNSVGELEAFPKIGRKVPELEIDIFRERIVEGYRVIYLVQGNSIEILTIVHSRQDLLNHLKRKD
ncbi:MAG: type II toxin-antitoxin system RelE/ParE family toxin [Balneolaceae bacterium]